MMQYTVFITGANRGLGLEFVRQYASENWRVLASCRNLVHAKELHQLAQHFDNITLLQLDITNPIQLGHIADKYSDTNIDLLINNASARPKHDDLGHISIDNMKEAFLINAIAPLKVAEKFLDNVSRSHLKTVISISNKMGSIKENAPGESYSYTASKAALNMVMRNMAMDLKEKNIKVFMVHPGNTKAQYGGQNVKIDPEQSVINIRNLLHRLTESETGSFYDAHGNNIDW